MVDILAILVQIEAVSVEIDATSCFLIIQLPFQYIFTIGLSDKACL